MSIDNVNLRNLCEWDQRSASTFYTLILKKTVTVLNGQSGYVSITLRHNLTKGYKRKVMPCVIGLCTFEAFLLVFKFVWLGVEVDGSGGGCEQFYDKSGVTKRRFIKQNCV